MESGLPRNGVRPAPKWSQGRPEMESGPPRNGVRGPYFLLTFLLISPHPLICERGELYHLNERKNLLHMYQHVELVNYPFKGSKSVQINQISNKPKLTVALSSSDPGLKLSLGRNSFPGPTQLVRCPPD